jgi:hypothetical protein
MAAAIGVAVREAGPDGTVAVVDGRQRDSRTPTAD